MMSRNIIVLVAFLAAHSEACTLTGGVCVNKGEDCPQNMAPGNVLTTCFSSSKYCCVPVASNNPLAWFSTAGSEPQQQQQQPQQQYPQQQYPPYGGSGYDNMPIPYPYPQPQQPQPAGPPVLQIAIYSHPGFQGSNAKVSGSAPDTPCKEIGSVFPGNPVGSIQLGSGYCGILFPGSCAAGGGVNVGPFTPWLSDLRNGPFRQIGAFKVSKC